MFTPAPGESSKDNPVSLSFSGIGKGPLGGDCPQQAGTVLEGMKAVGEGSRTRPVDCPNRFFVQNLAFIFFVVVNLEFILLRTLLINGLKTDSDGVKNRLAADGIP